MSGTDYLKQLEDTENNNYKTTHHTSLRKHNPSLTVGFIYVFFSGFLFSLADAGRHAFKKENLNSDFFMPFGSLLLPSSLIITYAYRSCFGGVMLTTCWDKKSQEDTKEPEKELQVF